MGPDPTLPPATLSTHGVKRHPRAHAAARWRATATAWLGQPCGQTLLHQALNPISPTARLTTTTRHAPGSSASRVPHAAAANPARGGAYVDVHNALPVPTADQCPVKARGIFLRFPLVKGIRDSIPTGPSKSPTKGPMWGHPRCGLGAVGAVLEPFCGHFSPKIDMVS